MDTLNEEQDQQTSS